MQRVQSWLAEPEIPSHSLIWLEPRFARYFFPILSTLREGVVVTCFKLCFILNVCAFSACRVTVKHRYILILCYRLMRHGSITSIPDSLVLFCSQFIMAFFFNCADYTIGLLQSNSFEESAFLKHRNVSVTLFNRACFKLWMVSIAQCLASSIDPCIKDTLICLFDCVSWTYELDSTGNTHLIWYSKPIEVGLGPGIPTNNWKACSWSLADWRQPW